MNLPNTPTVSLQQFRQIASGTHNVGDVRIGDNGRLEKINNHVYRTGLNDQVLSAKENAAVRAALFNALSGDGRMTPDMRMKIEQSLLKDNAVRSLSRQEVRMYFAALDHGSAEGLDRKIEIFRHRDARLPRTAAVPRAALELSANEKLDFARVNMQRARQLLAQLGTKSPVTGTDDVAHNMQEAWTAFKRSVTYYSEQGGSELDFNVTKDCLAQLEGKVDFSKARTAEDARETLEELFDRAFENNLVPARFEDEAWIVARWEEGDDAPDGVEDPQAYFAPSTRDALHPSQAAAAQPADGDVRAPATGEGVAPEVLDVERLAGLVDELEDGIPFNLQARKERLELATTCETRIQAKVKELDRQISAAEAGPEGAERLATLKDEKRVCDVLLRRVAVNRAQTQGLIDTNPISYRNVLSAVQDWIRAAENLYCELRGGDVVPPRQREVARSELYLSLPSFDGVKDFNEDCPDAGVYLKGLCATFTERLARVLTLQGQTVGMKDLAAGLKQKWQDVLEHKEWNKIEKNYVLKLEGRRIEAGSTITPALKIPGLAENIGCTNGTYEGGKSGLMCHNFKTWHCVNLALSTATANGEVVYEGLRHGVVSTLEAENDEERGAEVRGNGDDEVRAAANENRATEIIKAAALTNRALLQKVEEAKGDEISFDLFMTSTSLLTPDTGRQYIKARTDDERIMLQDQFAAWQSVDGKPVEITVRRKDGGEVKVVVKPSVLPFNFGVNKWALALGPLSKLELFSGWKLSDEMNRRSVYDLLGKVDEFCRALQNDINAKGDRDGSLAYKLDTVKTLGRQIRRIYESRAERTEDNDAYKIVSRINVVTYLMGGTPAWNCKSGKDRTGELDVESKFLATLIAQKIAIPEPGATLTDEQKAAFSTIALQGGNHELQMYNTGLGGFKLDVASPAARVGGGEAAKVQRGASDYVGV